MSNQHTKIESTGSRWGRVFYVAIIRAALPKLLQEKEFDQTNIIYQAITENALRYLRGYTMTNYGSYETIIYLPTEKQARKLANEIDGILNNNNHNLF